MLPSNRNMLTSREIKKDKFRKRKYKQKDQSKLILKKSK